MVATPENVTLFMGSGRSRPCHFSQFLAYFKPLQGVMYVHD